MVVYIYHELVQYMYLEPYSEIGVVFTNQGQKGTTFLAFKVVPPVVKLVLMFHSLQI